MRYSHKLKPLGLLHYMKWFWYFDIFWQWYLSFTVNLNTYKYKNFWEKTKQIYIKKDKPLLSQVFQTKNLGQDMETS